MLCTNEDYQSKNHSRFENILIPILGISLFSIISEMCYQWKALAVLKAKKSNNTVIFYMMIPTNCCYVVSIFI